MKRRRANFLSTLLIAAFAFTMTFHIHASTSDVPKDRGRLVMPFGVDPETGLRVLSFEDEVSGFDNGDDDQQSGNRVQSIGKPDSGRAWMLDPSVYNQLSSAGQIAALRLNGRMPPSVGGRRLGARQSVLLPEALGDNIRVNDTTLDTIFHTHSETSVIGKGSTILVSFNEFGVGDNQFLDLDGYGISTDGGNTFAQKQPPNPANGENEGDGVVVFGQNSDVYYSGLAAVVTPGGGSKSIIGVSKSSDNGATFAPPVDASTSLANSTDIQDKEWVTVDQNPSSPNKGNVYVSWTDFTSTGRFIAFTRSTDGGATFEAPQMLSPQDNIGVQGSVPVVAPNGDLYVAFADFHSAIAGIGIRKSTDGGKTFSPEVRVARFTGPRTMTGGGGVRTNNFPSFKIDNNGTLHVVYDAWTISPVDRSDIFYVRSSDGGATFSTPVKLNDDGTTTTQFLPSIGIASDGSLGVKWWDRRDDVQNDSLTGVYMTISHDGGMTWGKNFRVTDQNWVFSPIETFFASAYHGDYDGITGDEAGNFLLSWSDERTGSSNVFFARIPAAPFPTPALPEFNISASKVYDRVLPGDSATFGLSTSAANGFAGTLSLTATPAFNGFSYNFASANVNAGDMASLTVSTSAATQPGNYLITVAAAGGGVTRKTNFRLTVFDPTRFAGLPVNATRTNGFTSMQAGIKVDAGGTIHMVVDDDTANVNEDDVLYLQSTDGKTFSTPKKISNNTAPTFALQSTLALDQAGNPYVVWTGINPDPSRGTFATFFSKSSDHGQTFSAPVIASGSSKLAEDPKIAVDKNGAIVIVYIDFGAQGSPIFAVRSTDGGVTFSPPSRVSQPGEVQNNPPYLAVDSRGAAYVVYEDASQKVEPVKFAIASDGQNFAASKTISDPNVDAFAPQIAIDGSDNVYVTFYDRFFPPNSINREIIVIKSTDRGASFGPQVNVSNNTGQSTFPSLILEDQGGVSVAWEDTTPDAQKDVLVARSFDGGATFGPPIDLSGDPGRSFGAFGGADGNGNLVVAWTDDSGANTDVFVSSLSRSNTGPPDFAVAAGSAVLTVQRATKAQLTININRIGGFTGNVTVTAPDLSSIKIKQPGGNVQSTTGNSVTFALKLKGGGPTGPEYVQVAAQDDSGRTRTAVMVLVIQPAGP